MEVPTNSSELPDWAREFIKKSNPQGHPSSSLVLKENEILFTNDMFTVSTGKTSSADEEMLTEDVETVELEVEVNLKYQC